MNERNLARCFMFGTTALCFPTAPIYVSDEATAFSQDVSFGISCQRPATIIWYNNRRPAQLLPSIDANLCLRLQPLSMYLQQN